MSDNRPPDTDDTDTGRDPIDTAYAEAQAVLSDDAARASRRAAVLAAVAREAQAAPADPPLTSRRSGQRLDRWRRAAWLPAACVAGLGLFVAVRIYPLVRPQVEAPPTEPQPPPAARASPQAPAPPAPPSPEAPSSPETVAPPPRRRDLARTEPPVASPVLESRRRAPVAPPPLNIPAPPLPLPPVKAPVAETPAPPQPVPPSPPAPPAPMAPSASQAPFSYSTAPAARTVQAFPAAQEQAARHTRPDPGESLRTAAAAGRITEVEALLDQGAPIDAAGADGDTALMKSIQADRPEVAAILYRRGASLDQRNHSGESARDMAMRGDAKLKQALGLSP